MTDLTALTADELAEKVRAAYECEHRDEQGDRWTYVEHEGKTWNRCEACGLLELWEGGMLGRTDHPALSELVRRLDAETARADELAHKLWGGSAVTITALQRSLAAETQARKDAEATAVDLGRHLLDAEVEREMFKNRLGNIGGIIAAHPKDQSVAVLKSRIKREVDLARREALAAQTPGDGE